MTDPITGKAIEVVGSEVGGILSRLFGPTADIMGSRMAEAYKRRSLERVITRAEAKANTERDGSIPARVAQEVFDKAQWAENEFTAEYFSGVLASSRSDEGKNDSGVTWTALVGRLSSDQLALHWALASGIQRRARRQSFESIWVLLKEQIVIDVVQVLTRLEWELTEEAIRGRLFEAAYGLRREGLITDLSHGSGDYLRDEVHWTKGRRYSSNANLLTCKLTGDGIGLLLQAIGRGGQWYDAIFTAPVSTAVDEVEDLPAWPEMKFVSDYDTITPQE